MHIWERPRMVCFLAEPDPGYSGPAWSGLCERWPVTLLFGKRLSRVIEGLGHAQHLSKPGVPKRAVWADLGFHYGDSYESRNHEEVCRVGFPRRGRRDLFPLCQETGRAPCLSQWFSRGAFQLSGTCHLTHGTRHCGVTPVMCVYQALR